MNRCLCFYFFFNESWIEMVLAWCSFFDGLSCDSNNKSVAPTNSQTLTTPYMYTHVYSCVQNKSGQDALIQHIAAHKGTRAQQKHCLCMRVFVCAWFRACVRASCREAEPQPAVLASDRRSKTGPYARHPRCHWPMVEGCASQQPQTKHNTLSIFIVNVMCLLLSTPLCLKRHRRWVFFFSAACRKCTYL